MTVLATRIWAEGDALPPLVTAAEMHEPRHRDHAVRVQGILKDFFPDELNPLYVYIVLQTDSGPVYAASLAADQPVTLLQQIVDAKVEMTGFCRPAYSPDPSGRQPRLHLGRVLALHGASCIRVLSPAPKDPFLVPEIVEENNLYPYEIQRFGKHRTRGRVLSVWGGNTILIETPEHAMMRVEMSANTLPSCGDFIEIVGYPDTDIFHINFTRAIWRPTTAWHVQDAPARDATAAEVMTDGHGATKIDVSLYGKPLRIKGVVKVLPGGTDNSGVFLLDNDGYVLPVDMSSCRERLSELIVGSIVRATGICIFNIENYRPNTVFPQITGFTLVVRKGEDIEVISRPPWWTAGRLAVALSVAVGLLVVILVWNRRLKILSEKRGRELAKEQVERATTELKVMERTRLSVELHDALSQTLSGIAMQLGAIRRFAASDLVRMSKHIEVATRTLKSCRDEMRNLLGDLRSQLLDEPDMEKALVRILEPQMDDAELHVRFTVPRARLTDMTARSLYSMIRELAVNAIRHGHATSIHVAGCIEDGRLLCSVRDNGEGFDPASAPGPEEGHFGLQGIRERMDAANGSVEIESSPGKGTRVVISMPAPADELMEEP